MKKIEVNITLPEGHNKSLVVTYANLENALGVLATGISDNADVININFKPAQLKP